MAPIYKSTGVNAGIDPYTLKPYAPISPTATNTEVTPAATPTTTASAVLTPAPLGSTATARMLGNFDIAPGSTPMDASKIGTQTPLVIPTTNPASKQAALGGLIEAQAQQYAQSLVTDAEVDPLQAKDTSLRNSLESTMQKLLGKGARSEELSTGAGIPEKQMLVTSLTNQIAAKTLAYRRQIESLRSNANPNDSAGKFGSAVNTAVADIERKGNMELADLAVQQAAANNDLTTATDIIKAKLEAEFEPLEQSLNYLKYFYEDNKSQLTKKQEQRFEAKIAERTRLLDEQRAEKSQTAQYVVEAIRNGVDNKTLVAAQKAGTSAEALAILSPFIGKLDREMAALDRQLKTEQINKIKNDIIAEKDTANLANNVNALTQEGDPVSNKEALAAILSGKAVSAGTKGRLAPANAVMNAVAEVAANRQNGKFAGVGWFGRAKEFYKGLVNMQNPEATKNYGDLSALNLKTQQWASGASLTESQTKMVMKMVPDANDSDKRVREKMNQLYNYMTNQVESELLTDGVNVNFTPVNLFETLELYNQASPEQKAQIKAAGLI